MVAGRGNEVWFPLCLDKAQVDLGRVFVQFSQSHLFKGWPLAKAKHRTFTLSLAPMDSAHLHSRVYRFKTRPIPTVFLRHACRPFIGLIFHLGASIFFGPANESRGVRMWARVRRPDTWRDHHVSHPLWSTSHVGIHTWVNRCSPAVPNKPLGCRRVVGMVIVGWLRRKYILVYGLGMALDADS